MIGLSFPKTSSNVWFQAPSADYFGPFTISGEYAMESIVFDAFGDTFEWSKGIHGENNVTHNRTVGQIVYNPSVESFVRNPSCTKFPNLCMKGNAVLLATNKIVSIEAHSGFNPHGLMKGAPYVSSTHGWCDRWYYWDSDLSESWIRAYTLSVKQSDYRSVCAWYSHYITDIRFDINSKQVTYKWWRAGTTFPSPLIKCPEPVIPTEETMTEMYKYFREPERDTAGVYHLMSNNSADAIRIDGMLLSPRQVMGVVKECYKDLLPPETEDEPHIYQSLVARCVNQVDHRKLNIYEFIQGFTDPKQLIPKLLNLKKILKLKDVASDYLSYIYGILPTISDLGSIIDYFKSKPNYYDRNGYIVLTSVETDNVSSESCNMETAWRAKVAIDEEDPRWLDLRKQYDNLGRLPTVKEIWELLPYSFVIDWFVGIGDMLKSLQAEGWKLRLPIRYYTFSKKSVTVISETLADGSITYNLTRTNYHRWVTDQCPSVFLPPELETTFLDRWIEGAALIIARKR